MRVLENLEPKRVFHYFEDICQIPHGSTNTKEISDYLVQFAIDHQLKYVQDTSNNVIIWKPGTAGYENSAPVMLQGHIDMVCEKEADCPIDMEKEGLKLLVNNGIISADGTTLGGDDGIAVAYNLALLDSKDIPHPPLEAVFTVDEEIGMLGAAAMDMSVLKSRIMLNIDSEDEGYLLVSCAGGTTATCHLPIQRTTVNGQTVTIKVSGGRGGHSGVEIDKGRANSNMVLSRMLWKFSRQLSYCLIHIEGGKKDNAIPNASTAKIVLKDAVNEEVIQKFVNDFNGIIHNEFTSTDPDLKVSYTFDANKQDVQAMDAESTKRILCVLRNVPNGIQRMSFDIEGLVQTSLNLGILVTQEQEVTASFAVRSSVTSEKDELVERLVSLVETLGGTVTCTGDYPAWEYQQESPLRDLMIEVFEKQYGRKPVVQALHAGVECGLFAGKLPGLDCVSFGPDMTNIHTFNESLDVASAARTWEYLVEILKRLK